MSHPAIPAVPPPTEPTVTPAGMIDAYVKLRDRVKEIKDRQSKELEPYTDLMHKLETAMLAHMQGQGVDSIKTPFGTCYQSTTVSYKVEDAQAFFDFCSVHNRLDLIERRANKGAVEEFVADTQTLPPGLARSAYTTVNFRRS